MQNFFAFFQTLKNSGNAVDGLIFQFEMYICNGFQNGFDGVHIIKQYCFMIKANDLDLCIFTVSYTILVIQKTFIGGRL